MSSGLIVGLIAVLAIIVAVALLLRHHGRLQRAKAIERGLKMVPLQIHLPPSSEDTEGGTRNVSDVLREKTAQAEVLYNLIGGTAKKGFSSRFYGQRHVAFELVAAGGIIHFYAAVPVALVDTVSQAIVTAYPGARVQEAEDHNIFNQSGRLSGTMGGEFSLKSESAYPIATYQQLERDPMEALINTMSGLAAGEGIALQFLVRPASGNWVQQAAAIARRKRRQTTGTGFTPKDMALAAIKAPEQRRSEAQSYAQSHPLSGIEEQAVQAIEEKTKHPGFETLIRAVVSTDSAARSQALISNLATVFALFEAPGLNGFSFSPAADSQGLVTAFIFRFFPPSATSMVLNSVELATLFHLPDAQFTPTMNVDRQMSKQVDGPPSLPATGLLLGSNVFREIKKEIHLTPEDRRRHTYIIGQTGTGKSTMLENLVTQDMLAGNGLAFIDPHGDTAEKLLGLVPKERAEDVIYFNPADMDYPMGLNLFEFTDPAEKDFLIQESINMLYKIYDPGKTGIIGPRFEQWYRNAALTLMADPGGSTFIEIPKVFTDTEYLKRKFRYLKDPTVIDFWTKEMGQTSDYHKSEMLGWFASKFGAFLNNEMMRNILGQTKSSFHLRDVMDQKKILIVNLSKGRIGELNSQLLGLIFVIKFQAAAMSRASTPEAQRSDFCLYVDEFQNFSTDSFASILSEARKYRLNLIVANQFIGQLSDEIRDAVFGNIGTIVSHRVGPDDAEFMVKQFAPVFDARDLVNIPNFNSVVKLLIGGLPSQPFSMVDLPYLTSSSPELALAIKQLSAAKYGRARSEVEADITGRLNGHPAVAPLTAPLPTAPPVASAPAVAPLAAPMPPAPVLAAPAEPQAVQPAAPLPEAAPAPVAPAKPAGSLSIADIVKVPTVTPAAPVPPPESASLPIQAAPAVAPLAAPMPPAVVVTPVIPPVPPAVPLAPSNPMAMPPLTPSASAGTGVAEAARAAALVPGEVYVDDQGNVHQN